MSVILSSFNNIELAQADKLHSVEQQVMINSKKSSFVMDATESNLRALEKRGHEFYIPSDLLKHVNEDSNAKVYFDLECHPFYQKIKEVIEKGITSNGVFRFRRISKGNNPQLIADDLYVLSLLFGEPKEKHIKKSKLETVIRHIILMIRFESGVMAHVEFTFANVNRIELEWSGIKQIVEFDSENLRGQLLPLQYSANDLVSSAKKIDAVLMDKVRYYKNFVAGGALI
ncbi:hypothetical protein MKZ20_01840 [Psychrobacillus sp. FSL K6-2684]|uniref:hypothetical protein n=1 Tax=unclassified Psychrobacillus TaxID=2636677 RepID=UPI0012474660|nr:hypothetical protein [Psychrobacillus sp. AK 1817]QEY21085.1 hypothetical protein D0S48_10480 [Psychrobacillus sp. AK 1817]